MTLAGIIEIDVASVSEWIRSGSLDRLSSEGFLTLESIAASGTGFAITVSGTTGGPLGLGALIFRASLLNRRRRRQG
jgi:hypothetical protein